MQTTLAKLCGHYIKPDYYKQAEALYVIESGQVTTLRQLANGHTQWIQTIGAGNLLGERAFYQQALYLTSAITQESTTLYRLSAESWQQLQQQHPLVVIQLQSWILKRLSTQLTHAYQDIDNLLR